MREIITTGRFPRTELAWSFGLDAVFIGLAFLVFFW